MVRTQNIGSGFHYVLLAETLPFCLQLTHAKLTLPLDRAQGLIYERTKVGSLAQARPLSPNSRPFMPTINSPFMWNGIYLKQLNKSWLPGRLVMDRQRS